MTNKLYTDVLIIGGGVIGSSICYYLSKKGINTVLVERFGISSGSSGACDGFIFLQSKKDKDLCTLTLESLKKFTFLSEELSYDTEFEKCGGLVIFTDEGKFRLLDDKSGNENKSENRKRSSIISKKDGIKGNNYIKKIDRLELKKIEPFISKKVIAATSCGDEGQVNPINLNFGFIEASKRNKAKILTYEEVVSFNITQNENYFNEDITYRRKISKVYTANREIIPEEVVCACGAWSKKIGDMAGTKIPVIPRKGTLIVTEALPKIINHVILDFDYLCCKYEENRELGFTIEQTKSGNLLIGSTREFAGFDDRVDFNKLSKVIYRAKEIFPFLGEVSIIRSFCGFRPYSPDLLPILGKVQGFDNFWLAAGHEGDGIALSPITGILMSELIGEKINSGKILNNFLGVDLKKFSPERFNKV